MKAGCHIDKVIAIIIRLTFLAHPLHSNNDITNYYRRLTGMDVVCALSIARNHVMLNVTLSP